MKTLFPTFLIIFAALSFAVVATPPAASQACSPFDPHGEVGIYEGRPHAEYVVLDCKVTPIHLRVNASEW